MALADDFKVAQEKVKTLKSRPSDSTLLELYSLYKQATEGDATGKRPGLFDLKARAKFDAWSGRKGMNKDDGARAYVALVERLLKA